MGDQQSHGGRRQARCCASFHVRCRKRYGGFSGHLRLRCVSPRFFVRPGPASNSPGWVVLQPPQRTQRKQHAWDDHRTHGQ